MAERLKRLGFLPKPWNLAFVNANQAGNDRISAFSEASQKSNKRKGVKITSSQQCQFLLREAWTPPPADNQNQALISKGLELV